MTVGISVEFAWYLLTVITKRKSCSQLNIKQGDVCEALLLYILDRMCCYELLLADRFN